MVSVNPTGAALFVIVVLGSLAQRSIAFAESFDRPLKKTVMDLGRSRYLMPDNPSPVQLSCIYYPGFMIKELDDPGLKGTRWVTITPAQDGHLPRCRLSHSSTERFVHTEAWWGFEGVKGRFLFLEAADGDNGGMPFRVLDWKTRKVIFRDSARWDGHPDFAYTYDGKLSMGYLRVVVEGCSIPKDGASCWNKFREKFALLHGAVPVCTGYRREGEKEWVVGDEGVAPGEINTPSVIAYPVVIDLSLSRSVRAVPGQVQCTPVE